MLDIDAFWALGASSEGRAKVTPNHEKKNHLSACKNAN